MKKTFILDTNVLLHDPNAFMQFGDNDVIIPFQVLEEIDKFKKPNVSAPTPSPHMSCSAREYGPKLQSWLPIYFDRSHSRIYPWAS